MEIQPASFGSLAAFCAIVTAILGMVIAATARAAGRRAALGLAAAVAVELIVVALVVGNGLLAAGGAPGLMAFLVISNVLGLWLGLSPLGGRLATLPLAWLVAFQAFRLPLELVLHSWFRQGTIPETMTWTGSNLDIVSGIAALVLAPLAAGGGKRARAAAWAFNVVGGLLLINVARVAALSAPLPFGWGLERPLLVALHLPYALIVPVCVAGALAGHVVLTRALLAGR